ncbi:hypothetical protein VNI00_007805 [Paramarasmius palmivorus]|uniref:Uncharacterized protein n=1 Tax=Paramarasmius palmivorus TaxID=297713 RepID=A0AAW0CZC1_9AGAR
MIAGLSKAVTLYLAPVLALTAILLSLFAYLAPVVMLPDRVALLTVTPSTALTQLNGGETDGVSIFIGMLGSCSRPNKDADLNCTVPSLSPEYDLSALPSSAPTLLLSSPPASSPAFIAVALTFSILFFFTFTLISFRHKMGEKMSAALDKPLIHRLSAWIGFFGFFIGITSFLIVRMWFGKAVEDFNRSIRQMGQDGPQFIAGDSNAFTMVWVAYAFYAVPVICSLAKLNIKPAGK